MPPDDDGNVDHPGTDGDGDAWRRLVHADGSVPFCCVSFATEIIYRKHSLNAYRAPSSTPSFRTTRTRTPRFIQGTLRIISALYMTP